MSKSFYVYIMNSATGTIYTGVTNNLARRVYEHKTGLMPGFTSKYKCNRLAYFEQTTDVKAAIQREKQIKSWARAKKLNLIKSLNPIWRDLSEDF